MKGSVRLNVFSMNHFERVSFFSPRNERHYFYKEASIVVSPIMTKSELFLIDAGDNRSTDGILYAYFNQNKLCENVELQEVMVPSYIYMKEISLSGVDLNCQTNRRT